RSEDRAAASIRRRVVVVVALVSTFNPLGCRVHGIPLPMRIDGVQIEHEIAVSRGADLHRDARSAWNRRDAETSILVPHIVRDDAVEDPPVSAIARDRLRRTNRYECPRVDPGQS